MHQHTFSLITNPVQNYQEWILKYHKMNDWCHNNCRHRWGADNREFWFDDEKDYLIFILRWG